ncbi:MAG: hypothetical protein ABI539_09280, partial [Acidobacteriota bacterium]
MKMFLNQVNPNALTVFIIENVAKLFGGNAPAGAGVYPDYDKKPKFIKAWAAGDWRKFVDGFTQQSMMWHNKFWLIPPADFSLFDLREGGVTWRPNVFCSFKLIVQNNNAGAHRTIEVVNLQNPAAGFRSDSGHYDSEDTNLTPHEARDVTGQIHRNKQPTIAHEVGHALGLPHIGETRGLQACSDAKLVYQYKDFIKQDWLAAIYRGGNGAAVCYGHGGSAGDINNIMGQGAAFANDNASPWLNRLGVHLTGKTDIKKWTARVGHVPVRRL